MLLLLLLNNILLGNYIGQIDLSILQLSSDTAIRYVPFFFKVQSWFCYCVSSYYHSVVVEANAYLDMNFNLKMNTDHF